LTLPERADLDTYGGVKENVRPIVDRTTEMDADDENQRSIDVAMMTQTSIRAVASFVGTASSPPTAPTSGYVHVAQWGSALLVKPTFARTATGVFTITWPTTVTDELGTVHTLNFQYALQPSVSGTTAFIATATLTAANVLTVRVFDAAGAASDAVGAVITAFVI